MKKLLFIALVGALLVTSCKPSKQEPRKALIETSFGNITVELLDSTPKHRDNFVKLVEEGFYNDLLFHRVINEFMIQGGDPNSKDAEPGKRLGAGGPGYNIPAEIKYKHYRGALAAARRGGPSNPEMKSSGSQFYIVQGKTKLSENELLSMGKMSKTEYTEEEKQRYLKEGGSPFLDNQYTVFGYVVDGMDVVDKIAKVEKDRSDRPVEDVKMKIKMLN